MTDPHSNLDEPMDPSIQLGHSYSYTLYTLIYTHIFVSDKHLRESENKMQPNIRIGTGFLYTCLISGVAKRSIADTQTVDRVAV